MTEKTEYGIGALRKAEALLRAAHDLYANPSTATAREFARDRHGHPLPLARVNDERATRWGPTGALLHAAFTGWEVETEVIYVPPGSPLDLTGPPFVLAAIDCLADGLVALFQRNQASRPAVAKIAAGDNPVLDLFERMTESARGFWLGSFIAELPEFSRVELLTSFDIAVLSARTQRDRRKQGRQPGGESA